MNGKANRAAVWRRRLEKHARGNLSVAEFCRQEGISQPSFYQWRKRLAQSPQFVPVEVSAELLSSSGVRIELPGGAVVRLPHDASQEMIASAIQAACQFDSTEEEPSC